MKQWFKDHSKAISIAAGVILAPCALSLLLFCALHPEYIMAIFFVAMAIFFVAMALFILCGIGYAIYQETKKFIDML